VATFIEKTKRK